MAKTMKNVVREMREIRDLVETAYAQIKRGMATGKYEDLESLRITLIAIADGLNAVIDELELDAVVDAITELDAGDRNDGNQ